MDNEFKGHYFWSLGVRSDGSWLCGYCKEWVTGVHPYGPHDKPQENSTPSNLKDKS